MCVCVCVGGGGGGGGGVTAHTKLNITCHMIMPLTADPGWPPGPPFPTPPRPPYRYRMMSMWYTSMSYNGHVHTQFVDE